MATQGNNPNQRNKSNRDKRRTLRLKERKKTRREATQFRQKIEEELLQENPVGALEEDSAKFVQGPPQTSQRNKKSFKPGAQKTSSSGEGHSQENSGTKPASDDPNQPRSSGRRGKPKVLRFGSARVVVGGDKSAGRPEIKTTGGESGFRWKRPQAGPAPKFAGSGHDEGPQRRHPQDASKKTRAPEPARGQGSRAPQGSRGPQGSRAPQSSRGPQGSQDSRYASSDQSQELVEGRLDMHPDGFGFLIPKNAQIENVYLPEETLKYCMHRDQILVRRELSRNPQFKSRGSLVEILKRAQSEVIGTYRSYRGGSMVVPLEARDRRHAFKVENVPADMRDLKSGATVLIKISKYPEVTQGTADLLSEVKEPAAAHNDTLRVLLSAGWPRNFSAAAVTEAQVRAEKWKENLHPKRRDMKDAPFVTIDGRDARDFDDAVYAEKEGTNIRLWVAIADVSHFVKPASSLDVEAFERSTSVYFPDHVVPMLPEILSNGLCSLNPFEDRLSLICEMRIDHAGLCREYEFFEGIISSKRRMTYEEMQSFIESDAWSEQELKPLAGTLSALVEVYERLKTAKFSRGAIDLDLPEAHVQLNADGTVRDIQTRTRLDAHRLIEECMLIANDSAAKFIHDKMPEAGMYRIHEQPDARKIEDLMKFLALSGLNLSELIGGNPAASRREPKNKNNGDKDFSTDLLSHPKDFNRLLKALKEKFEPGDPLARAVQMLILRTQKQARYGAEPLGHFALATKDYTHFTSPIRRYPDLIVHRLIKAALGVEYSKEKLQRDLESQGRHTSDQERAAMDMERKVIDIKKCRYLEPHLGEEFEAFVQGVTEKGVFCQLDGHFVEGLVHAEQMARGFKLHFDPDLMAYAGPGKKFLRIGSRVKIQLVGVDIETRRIDFELLEVFAKPL